MDEVIALANMSDVELRDVWNETRIELQTFEREEQERAKHRRETTEGDYNCWEHIAWLRDDMRHIEAEIAKRARLSAT